MVMVVVAVVVVKMTLGKRKTDKKTHGIFPKFILGGGSHATTQISNLRFWTFYEFRQRCQCSDVKNGLTLGEFKFHTSSFWFYVRLLAFFRASKLKCVKVNSSNNWTKYFHNCWGWQTIKRNMLTCSDCMKTNSQYNTTVYILWLEIFACYTASVCPPVFMIFFWSIFLFCCWIKTVWMWKCVSSCGKWDIKVKTNPKNRFFMETQILYHFDLLKLS